jgi:hypothetical protein
MLSGSDRADAAANAGRAPPGRCWLREADAGSGGSNPTPALCNSLPDTTQVPLPLDAQQDNLSNRL